MNAQPIKSKVRKLRDRDGEHCWLCYGLLDIDAPVGDKKHATIEHRDAVSNGGSADLSNLVLCHSGCNHHLGNRPREEKDKIREKWARNRQQMLLKPRGPRSQSKTQASPARIAAAANGRTGDHQARIPAVLHKLATPRKHRDRPRRSGVGHCDRHDGGALGRSSGYRHALLTG